MSLKVEQTCISLKILQHRPPLIQPAVCEKLSAINVEELFKRACSHLSNLPAYQELSRNETKISKGAPRHPLFSVTLSVFLIIHICGIVFVLLPKLEAYLFPWLVALLASLPQPVSVSQSAPSWVLLHRLSASLSFYTHIYIFFLRFP